MSTLTDEPKEDAQSPLWAGLQASLVTGAAGFVVGGTIGIAKSKQTLALWTIASSLQWAFLGGTYWGTRTALMQQIPANERDPMSKLAVSALASGASFAFVGAAIRGRQSVLPGGIMGTVYGFAGQGLYNVLDRRHTEAVERADPRGSSWERFKERLINSKWSPISRISDDDYLKMLGEKRLRIDTEVALLDEEISELEQQQTIRQEIAELRQAR